METTWDGLPVAPEPPFACAIVVWRERDGRREFLLLHRLAPGGPGFDREWAWTPPSGARQPGEEPDAAATRELREETGLDVAGPVAFLGVFADPGRDPRGRTISLVHATTLRGPLPEVAGGDDAAEAAWLDPRAPLELAFDHAEILADARRFLLTGTRPRP
jgi:8-oxo-dGTP diphosphatase